MTHTDHPAQHWDRTCPACAGLVIDYMRLRLAIGVLGVLLPFVLVAVAGERESISAYYHSPVAWATVAGVAGGSIYAPEALAVLLFGAAWIFKGRAA